MSKRSKLRVVAAAKVPRDRGFRQGIEEIHREAAGLLSLAVLRPVDAVDLIAAAFSGDGEAMQFLDAINKLCDEIQTAPKTAPILCVSCPRPLSGAAYSFALAMPDRSRPSKVIGMGICPQCGTTKEEITRRATAHLRKIWPGLRAVTVTHQDGGHA